MAAAVGSLKRLPKIQSPTTRRMPASMVRSTSDIGPMARSSLAAHAGADLAAERRVNFGDDAFGGRENGGFDLRGDARGIGDPIGDLDDLRALGHYDRGLHFRRRLGGCRTVD